MSKFFEDCKGWWKLYSVRLAAAIAALVGFLTSDPSVLFSVISFIPSDPVTRAVFAVAVGLLTFLAPVLARMWPQENTNDTDTKA